MNKHSVIDMVTLHAVFGQNTQAMKSFINNFIDITQMSLEKITAAITTQNTQLALDYLHKLKGPVGSSGFKHMYQLCEKAEESVANADWARALGICEDLQKQLQKIVR